MINLQLQVQSALRILWTRSRPREGSRHIVGQRYRVFQAINNRRWVESQKTGTQVNWEGEVTCSKEDKRGRDTMQCA